MQTKTLSALTTMESCYYISYWYCILTEAFLLRYLHSFFPSKCSITNVMVLMMIHTKAHILKICETTQTSQTNLQTESTSRILILVLPIGVLLWLQTVQTRRISSVQNWENLMSFWVNFETMSLLLVSEEVIGGWLFWWNPSWFLHQITGLSDNYESSIT